MKYQTTKKELLKCNESIIGFRYCQAQKILNTLAPVAYIAGGNGWQCDVYDFDGVTITSGYYPICKNEDEKTKNALIRLEQKAIKKCLGFLELRNELRKILKNN